VKSVSPAQTVRSDRFPWVNILESCDTVVSA